MKKSLKQRARESAEFLKDKLFGKKSVDRKIIDSKPIIGHVYFFRYIAKHRKTLPFWDAAPLIIAIGPATGGFYGLNMHYLPPAARLKLFRAIRRMTVNVSERQRMKISYKILQSASHLKAFKPTLHRYLYSHVKSPFERIPFDDWEKVVMIPTAKWKGASSAEVYKASREAMK